MWELEVRQGHGSLQFSLLFFLLVVFVLKFHLFERGQMEVVGITESLVLCDHATPHPCSGRGMMQRSKPFLVTRVFPMGGVSGAELIL